jgi:hypothetical protein
MPSPAPVKDDDDWDMTPTGGGAVSPTQVKRAASAPRPVDVQRLIVRQSALKAAVEIAVGWGMDYMEGRTSTEIGLTNVLHLADSFTAWVFEEGAYGLDVAHGGVSERGGLDAPSPSPAAVALADVRAKAADRRANYLDEDAVCPACGLRDHLRSLKDGGWFCSKRDGGCGFPPKGERLDQPISYGQWKHKNGTATSTFRRPDATVVSPQSHPSRNPETPALEPWQ